MDQGGRGGFPANEEAHYGSPIPHSILVERNLICILSSIGRIRHHRSTNQKHPQQHRGLRKVGKIFYQKQQKGKMRNHTFECQSTNNEAKYEALLAGLGIARLMSISNIEVKMDSKLVASQINRSYEASKDNMIKYLAKAMEYASEFKSFSIENIPRNMNQKADVLSKLASVAFNHLTKEVLVEVLNERSTEGQEVHVIVEEEGDNWMTPIMQCLEDEIWPKDKNKTRCL
ncbi:reverse transcriptase domain-containing protein [Tanacetum coccineum]|uniref:Reverse transcriptase domain-containing protein n=1 Tax=Tanacetum coccineum TaxID=301880 RepID=A0ABQ5GF33_9ASTR